MFILSLSFTRNFVSRSFSYVSRGKIPDNKIYLKIAHAANALRFVIQASNK